MEKINRLTEDFLIDMKGIFGENLIAISLYGPAVRLEKKAYPYIKFLVLLKDSSPSEIAGCSSYVKKWYKNLIAIPLFIQCEFINNSLDTFPLEFIEMGFNYKVIYGEDPLKNLNFLKNDVRNQCEREIKGKLLHLREEYIELRNDQKQLADLVNRSFETFRILFSGALYLKNIDSVSGTQEMISAVIENYDLDDTVFKKLSGFAKGDIKLNPSEEDEIFDKYVEELEKLSVQLDNLDIKEER